jgi:protein-tyrosine phosphatase
LRLSELVKAEKRIVIHCRGGIGRTATLVCALLRILGI